MRLSPRTLGRLIAKHRSSVELRVISAFLVLAGFVWFFAVLAEEVAEGDTEGFDTLVLGWFRTGETRSDPLGPPWLESAFVDWSALGSGAVVILVTAVTVAFTLVIRRLRTALLIAVCASGALVGAQLLKSAFGRERPDVFTPMVELDSLAFPSGHASASSALYLTLGVLVAQTLSRRRARAFVVAAGAMIAFLVGLTRVYLGVHYPTDVVAGWTFGAAWALLCGLAARGLARRGVVEPAAAAPPQSP